MPLLIADLLAVAIFVGGGYGTLYWLVQPETVHPAQAGAVRTTGSRPGRTPPAAIGRVDPQLVRWI